MLNKIKGLLNKKAKFDLDNDGKIESYRDEIKGVFSHFKIMSDKLEAVNAKLQDVVDEETLAQEMEQDNLKRIIEETNKRLEESEKLAQKASQEIIANKKLQEKVNEFLA